VGNTFLAGIGKICHEEERIFANVAYTTSQMNMEWWNSLNINETALKMFEEEHCYKDDITGILMEFTERATEKINAFSEEIASPETRKKSLKDIMTLNKSVLDYIEKDKIEYP